ncbi:hypothetical protein [Stigmatella aurantiaca]|uniref:Conserved uncharacterized protein n=1 Tax=Stigmatella aurantiaca (strain DW4/3-1) TaxID=378806 RepID=Q08ZR5_STIAD|nr:hypothetical protein [Stigmatella aurantiaca]ADO74821.1 conserved uncharacterized protein [Stigmatella aurantiaca DW4/3-1]EAU65981.1 conserved hypothetical protein [Stigmatella aurantiaca DW4/3-1]
MKKLQAGTRLNCRVMREVLGRFTGGLLSGLVLLHAAGCGPVSPVETEARQGTSIQALHTSLGLSVNGLSVNGLSVNGLSVNGLSVNGLETATFREWFNTDPSLREITMHYLIQCAVPAGQERTFTSSVSGLTYTWYGLLGLAPGWAQGALPTVLEQQAVSACLAAHVNTYGKHVAISVQGRTALGEVLASTPEELETFTEEEACFFGNLFTEEGTFAANGSTQLKNWESTLRTCGLSPRSDTPGCAPITHVGSCKRFCTWDKETRSYTRCTYQGVEYVALTTRMQASDIYRCGDGVCQATESCGTGKTYNSCAADCGQCP